MFGGINRERILEGRKASERLRKVVLNFHKCLFPTKHDSKISSLKFSAEFDVELLLSIIALNREIFRRSDIGFSDSSETIFNEFLNWSLIRGLSPDYIKDDKGIARLFCQLLKAGDVIITFNYDLLIDQALFLSNLWTPLYREHHRIYNSYWNRPFYFQDSQYNKVRDDLLLFEPKLDLIKLHGSLNWLTVTRSFQSSVATLPDDNNDLAMLYNPENSVSYFNSKDIFNYSIDFAQINKDLTIIKPTIGKEYAKWPFANLVKKAMDALNSAKNVYLLGYSMPMYDTISEFLILSVNENAKLRIVNKDKDAEVLKERIARGSKLEWNQIEEFSDGIEEWIKKQIRGSLK